MAKAVFHVFTPQQFIDHIVKNNYKRKITFIQNHHTWVPGYAHFQNRPDEMYWLESMRKSHLERGWNDIGQNITTFPNGTIAICRPIDLTPAGIAGANTGAICIEHLGNFDEGKDQMTPDHREAILVTNAVLCQEFGLKPNKNTVVYHHWYGGSGKRFNDIEINSGYVLRNQLQKTCPGTGFFSEPGDAFKGNTITAAENNFYPLIKTQMQNLVPGAAPVYMGKKVNAAKLNVRAGAGTGFAIVKTLAKDTKVSVYQSLGEWSLISTHAQEWVSSKYLI
ncbi:N-acetylmuramoyl-L-alanine amidase [Flavobacterium sp. RHBU_24]|uniref:N-acetylmuramoyl-L-alanine amidase n=1 Tax=Flavobacterium sp. RHBU_24 TaxID=3391185 RepID=UPI003984C2A7